MTQTVCDICGEVISVSTFWAVSLLRKQETITYRKGSGFGFGPGEITFPGPVEFETPGGIYRPTQGEGFNHDDVCNSCAVSIKQHVAEISKD